MSKIVVKIGGSNLKDIDSVNKVIRTIKQYNQPLIIVVSAFYGITGQLIDMLHNVQTDRDRIDWLTNFLSEMKMKIINDYIDDEVLREKTFIVIKDRLQKLEYYLLGVHYIGETPKFIEDVVLSYGERLSSYILSSILQYHNIDCEEILPEQLGLYTDGEYGNATVNFEKSEKIVKVNLAPDKTFIVPGFYGISMEKKVTLLGRGGSDYSAAAIARCIDAEFLDIWKDVDGFLSADPKIIDNPEKIETLTYTEAAELAYFGAKILHPRTIEPLMDRGIPIRIFNIEKSDDINKPRSVINKLGEMNEQIIKSVTYSNDFSILKLIGPGVGIKPGILAKVTSELGNRNINIKSVITAQTSINFLIAIDDLEKAYQLVRELEPEAVNNIIADNSVSLIAIVGEGILENHGIAARTFGAMSKGEINVKIISLGASPVAAYFIVDRVDTEKAINLVHSEFFPKN